MKKILMIALCLGIVPMLFAAQEDAVPTQADHAFRVANPTASPYTGPRSTPTLVDQIDLSPLHSLGYCWGVTYDWEMDVLWVSLWNSAYTWVYAIQKTSPCTKVDSFQLGSGTPSYHLGMGFAGSGLLYMTGFDANIYEINMTTGAGSVFRTLPWSGAEGLGFNSIDDAVYPGDWTADQCAWAQPAQSGSWNTWSLVNVSGLSGAYSTSSPEYLFTVDENASQARFYQHSLSGGIPNTTPDSTWECDPGQTHASTADCAFDGQYVYILDQSGPDMIWVYDVGITPPPSAFWDFETGLQGWTHTNGQPFPAGWDVEPSGYKPSWTPPDAGDSTMWVDSDASSGVIQDTAWSPAVVPPTNMAWLVYGYGFYSYSGNDWLAVGVRTFSGGAWNAPVELTTYTADAGPAWDTLDVSAYAADDSIRVYFYYDGDYDWWASFDNVGLWAPPDHDVGCIAVTSPPEGIVTPADYDVIGQIHNYGGASETFDVTATVWDTTGWVIVFGPQTVTLTDFPAGADSLVNFGTVTFVPNTFYCTEIFTLLGGDSNPSNDTSTIYSRTAMAQGDVIFEMDVQTITGCNRLLGIEFDGTYFYVTGACDPPGNTVYVIDTSANLVWSPLQGTSTSWGWRDIAWDEAYTGVDRIDTLYASDGSSVIKFGIDLTNGTLNNHGSFPGPENPNRALAYDGDDNWFFTANFRNPCYKFNKDTVNIQSVGNSLAMYGAAYDPNIGPSVWWHSQDDPGTGWNLQITQMEPQTMTFPGYFFGYVPTIITSGMAGGLCYYSGFRGNMDVLFALVQGTPNDIIVGIFMGWTGIEEETGTTKPSTGFGFAPMVNPTKGTAISYTTTKAGHVSLMIYDASGRLVGTLVNSVQPAGVKTINWDTNNIANGVYFINLEAQGKVDTHKMILVK